MSEGKKQPILLYVLLLLMAIFPFLVGYLNADIRRYLEVLFK